MKDELRPLKLVIVGHVDHGKSTLIGRLLHETGSLPDGKVEELVEISRRRGVAIEWSFVLDALQAERDQAVTIDTTRIWFKAGGRRYAIIDAPGHREFVRNMLSGAAEADAAILMVDATEGVSEQTRRHAYLLHILGIRQVLVAINKMDAVGYDPAAFARVEESITEHLRALGVTPSAVIPISAREGDNLVERSARLGWFAGPTVLEALADFSPGGTSTDAPLRMRVQDVYRLDGKRVIVGRLDAGVVATGDAIVVSPTRAQARVTSIERWPQSGPPVAYAGESIGLTFDKPIFVERGDVLSAEDGAPAVASRFNVTSFWLDATPPVAGETLRLRMGPTEATVTIESVDRAIDTDSLEPIDVTRIPQYAVVDLTLRGTAFVSLDTRETNAVTSRCVLLRDRIVAGGGSVTHVGRAAAGDLHPHDHLVSQSERAARNGHSGAVMWLTGLSGAGKSTIALAVERQLFARGYNVYVLDGDAIRTGLSSDLGFSANDRTENIRRVGHVASLFADAGTIVLTAFISPFAQDRALARAAAGTGFHEIYVRADLATCEARDPSGLYRRARAGEIANFTGISSPYEPPERPDLIVDTTLDPVEHCVHRVVEYVVAATAAGRHEQVMI